MGNAIIRCDWTGSDPDYINYHDNEWGRPLHDDRRLFEMLVLEGTQAGLSWITILKKRESYRKAFDDFDVEKVMLYGDEKLEELVQNTGLIRNRLKLRAAVTNAKAFKKIQEEFGSFDKYLWGFVGGKPIRDNLGRDEEVPARTELSDKISADLKKRGFKFVGSTIICAYMHAVGLMNGHVEGCFCLEEGE